MRGFITLNSPASVPSGGQVVSQAAALAADPRQFGGGVLRPADEHHPAGRNRRVETGVGEGQLLGVADPELDGQVRRRGQALGRLDQVGAEIDADDGGAARGDPAGGPAGARRDVEHPLARLRRQADDGVLDRIGDGLADPVVMGAPGVPDGGGLEIVRLIVAWTPGGSPWLSVDGADQDPTLHEPPLHNPRLGCSHMTTGGTDIGTASALDVART
jgi:hypothetical protein